MAGKVERMRPFYRLLFVVLLVPLARADTVVLTDGTTMTGQVISENSQEVVIETLPGMRTELSRSNVRVIKRDTPQAARPAPPSLSPASGAPYGIVLPSGDPFPPGTIPQGPLDNLVARVGPGGVTRRDYERELRNQALSKGMAAAPEGGYAILEQKLTAADRKAALQRAIDEELMFQAALADGVLDQEWARKRINSEYFYSVSNAEAPAFTDQQIEAWYRANPQEFMAPVSVKIKYMNFPTETDEGGFGRKQFREAQADPTSTADWQDDGWVAQGQIPRCMMDQAANPEDVAALFKTEKGKVSPIIHGGVYTFVFWVVDKTESAGLRPLDQVKERVARDLAAEKLKLLNAIGESDPERYYRMALREGIHRRLRAYRKIKFTFQTD